MNRAQTYGLLLSHLEALHIKVERVYASYCFQVAIAPGESYRALVLARSADYWHQRIHLRRKGTRPDLVVCFAHDTCLPCAVLSLEEGYQYEPGELPKWYTPAKRNTQKGCMVLLGQLLAGEEAGFVHLAALPRATKYRYLARMKKLMHNRVGRPLIA